MDLMKGNYFIHIFVVHLKSSLIDWLENLIVHYILCIDIQIKKGRVVMSYTMYTLKPHLWGVYNSLSDTLKIEYIQFQYSCALVYMFIYCIKDIIKLCSVVSHIEVMTNWRRGL